MKRISLFLISILLASLMFMPQAESATGGGVALSTADSRYVNVTGDTMTGTLNGTSLVLSATGSMESLFVTGSATVSGNATAAHFYGDGSTLTGIGGTAGDNSWTGINTFEAGLWMGTSGTCSFDASGNLVTAGNLTASDVFAQALVDSGFVTNRFLYSGAGGVITDSSAMNLAGSNINIGTSLESAVVGANRGIFTDNLSVGYQTLSENIAGSTVGIRYYVGIEGNTDLAGAWMDRHTTTAGYGAHLLLARSRGATHASAAVVNDNDVLGSIYAVGYDGSDYGLSSQILMEVDEATPAAGKMGGAIVFKTSGTGTESLIERVRIGANGVTSVSSLAATPSAQQSLANDAAIQPNAAYVRVVGNGGAVVLDTDPAIADGIADGQRLLIHGTNDTNTVEIANACNTKTAGGLSFVVGLDDTIEFIWDLGQSVWVEISRSNNS